VTLSFRQTRIFVPTAQPFDADSWAETALGAIVAPLVSPAQQLEWYWFSRSVSDGGDSGDCDIAKIPESFAIDGLYRSLRLRYAIPTLAQSEFERRALELIETTGAKVSDFRDYPWIDDLGGDRFVGGDRSRSRRESRANLMARYLDALSRVTLDCVIGPTDEGRHAFEANDGDQNPHGSSFESIHHLFCNMTDVPTFVLVLGNQLATHWMPRPAGVEPYELRVKF
jgi:hypothetical protein